MNGVIAVSHWRRCHCPLCNAKIHRRHRETAITPFMDQEHLRITCKTALMLRRTLLALIFLALPLLAQSTRDADGTTPLHWAVRSDDVATVQQLLRSGANPSASNRYGIT